MPIQTPQQQAGIMSYYDAPDKGPKLDMKLILIFATAFAVFVVVVDRILTLL